MNYSPLRYPGGKAKIAKFIKHNIQNSNIENCTYIEPFAGGSGVALFLLFENVVNNIVINDLDKAVYSFWRAVIEDTSGLISMINDTPVTIEEWKKQRNIYLTESKYSLNLAFATFFLNRTNRSGIIKGGPIGGMEQIGEWRMDARYNKESLIKRIEQIASRKKNIKVYNKDIISFINNIIPKYTSHGFVYLDPPYYKKGKELYTNFLEKQDHAKIAYAIQNNIDCNWIVTYDKTIEILDFYSNYVTKEYDLNYSLAKKGKASELIIFKNHKYCPTNDELIKDNISINLRNVEWNNI